MVIRLDSPLFFANAAELHDRLLEAVDADASVRALVLDLEATSQIDTTSIDMLEELLDAPIVSAASKFAQPTIDAPASISVVTAADIRRFGYRTLAEILRGVRGLYLTYDRNYVYAGIRGFGRPGDLNTRLLVLLDGHRATPSNADGTVDIDTMPQSLITRVDVVTGGASAVYGSDAVAGVVNLVYKTKFDGVQLDAQTGISEYGDGFDRQVNLLAGKNFADGRGNVTLHGEFSHQSRIFGNQIRQSSDHQSACGGGHLAPRRRWIEGCLCGSYSAVDIRCPALRD